MRAASCTARMRSARPGSRCARSSASFLNRALSMEAVYFIRAAMIAAVYSPRFEGLEGMAGDRDGARWLRNRTDRRPLRSGLGVLCRGPARLLPVDAGLAQLADRDRDAAGRGLRP